MERYLLLPLRLSHFKKGLAGSGNSAAPTSSQTSLVPLHVKYSTHLDRVKHSLSDH